MASAKVSRRVGLYPSESLTIRSMPLSSADMASANSDRLSTIERSSDLDDLGDVLSRGQNTPQSDRSMSEALRNQMHTD